MKLRHISIMVIVLVIAGAGVWANRNRNKQAQGEQSGVRSEGQPGTAVPSAPSPAHGLRVGNNAIYMPEQLPGTTVSVGFAALAVPGFAVIHAGAGEGGAVAGASTLLPAGETLSGMEIALSRSTREGDEFTAILHADDGDGMFDPSKDQPVKDGAGNIVMMSFTVSTDAEAGGEVTL